MSVSTSIMNFLDLDAIRPLRVGNRLLKSDVALGMPAQKQNCVRQQSIRVEVFEENHTIQTDHATIGH
jgi:hypothetical protein